MIARLRGGPLGMPIAIFALEIAIRPLLFMGLFLNVSCNHLFYHPDRETHQTPAAVAIEFEELTVTSVDGMKLAAWHLKPPPSLRRGITLVQFHGNAQNMSTHFMYVAWLAPLGYDVVTFDYRGYGRSQGDAERAGTIKDGQAVLHHVRKHPVLGRGSVFALGQSLGGAVAVVAIATDPVLNDRRVISGLALDSTFGSYRGMARAALGSAWLTWPFQWPLSFLVTDELSAADHAAGLAVPVMSWHAETDPVVPLAQGRLLFDKFSSADKTWVTVQGEGHTVAFADPDSRHRVELVAFLQKFGAQAP